jgi:hypothetical protein
MMSTPNSSRGGLVWAIVGGIVLVAGIVAIVIGAIVTQPSPDNAQSPEPDSSSPSPAATATPSADAVVVDPSVIDHGWSAEPITTEPDLYMRAALDAASTFDTTKSTREEWLDYLDSWFTPDTRYSDAAEQRDAMAASQVELRQGVVLPQAEWDSLANEDGRVVARAGDVVLVPVTEDPSGDMSIGTADVTLTFTRADSSGGETSYEAVVRVSVQVLCGAGSVPTPDTAQRAGDCKVVRYFAEPLEP